MPQQTSIVATAAPRLERSAGARARTEEVDRAAAPLARPSLLRRALGPYAQHPGRWSSREVFFVTMSFLALVCLGLYHPYWARGGDSELYLAIARNLVRGDGYVHNGQPVALVPPLWPLVIAAGMWFTSVVGILKLMMPALYLVFLGCAYHVLRRMASPWIAAASVALTGILHALVVLTMWFHSDALFFALSWVALLLALQSGELYAQAAPRRAWLWRAVAASLCLGGAIATRWAGVLWWPIVAMAFLSGRQLFSVEGRRLTVSLWPKRLDAMWMAAIGSGLLAALVFFGLRFGLKVEPWDLDPRYDTFETGHYDIINQHERPTVGTHVNRLLRAPEWLSVLYWSELGRDGRLALAFSRLAAVTAIPLIVAGLVGLWRRQWIWLGLAGAWLPLVATWPHAVDRYSGPVAPLLICGTILGTIWLSRRLRARQENAEAAPPQTTNPESAQPRTALRLHLLPYAIMLVPLGICVSYNLGRYGLEVWARLDYFERYEGGIQPGLNRIGAYIRQNQPATGGEVGVTRTGFRPPRTAEEVEDRHQKVRGVRRNLTFLSDTTAIDLPAIEHFDPEAPWFLDWASQRNIRYFVVMPKHGRYFVHLHEVPWHAPKPPEIRAEEEYQLYELVGGEVGMPVVIRRVHLDGWPPEVLVVPGLEDIAQLGRKRRWLSIPYN